MTTFNIKAVDSFPEITRTGRTSEELKMIISSSEMSNKTGTASSTSSIEFTVPDLFDNSDDEIIIFNSSDMRTVLVISGKESTALILIVLILFIN